MSAAKFSQQDYDFIHRLRRDGVRLNFIAHYVYGVDPKSISNALYKRKKKLSGTESRLAENKKGTRFTGDAND